MAKDATGKAGGGGGHVVAEEPGHAATPDEPGDGPLQPGEAHPGVGEEDPFVLRRVVRKDGGQKVNPLTGELVVWEEIRTYKPKESHDD